MEVRCIDNKYMTDRLTVGIIYNAKAAENPDYSIIIDDNGNICFALIIRFESVEDSVKAVNAKESLKGKLTEEEAKILARNYYVDRESSLVDSWKEAGYIKQNPVEEAETILSDWDDLIDEHGHYYGGRVEYEILKEAIVYLKKQLEEVKWFEKKNIFEES